jgi:hypothetical protein
VECNDIVDSTQCSSDELTTSLGIRCVWVDEEEDEKRCQEVKTTCEELTSEGSLTCETPGAVISADGAKIIECEWKKKKMKVNAKLRYLY